MKATKLGPYQRILAAVDLGPATPTVVKRTDILAERLGASVDLIHVHEGLPDYATDAILDDTLREIVDKMQGYAHAELATLKAGQSRVQDVLAYVGKPVTKLVEVALEQGSDLIVVGPYLHGGIPHLMHSFSDHLLHQASQDVLAMRSSKEVASDEDEGYRHVLLATDLGPHNEPARVRAVQIAQGCNARLSLVHVVEHFAVDRSNEDIAPEDQDPLHYRQRHAEEKLAQLAAPADLPAVERKVVVSARTAKREVAAIAKEVAADLIVVGSHGHHGVEAILGSTAIGIVHRAECDVLVVRSG